MIKYKVMGVKKDNEQLQHEFVTGTAPKRLDGFYHGELASIIPKSFLEHIGAFSLRFYLPWKGKYFYKSKDKGDNVLPGHITKLLAKRYGTKFLGKEDPDGYRHAFPFRTKVTKGLLDNIDVFSLNYNLPENPERIREILDEIVCVGKDSYLGKAHIVHGHIARTIAFFRLKKTTSPLL